MNTPEKITRNVHYASGTGSEYEVLDEMVKMWMQAKERVLAGRRMRVPSEIIGLREVVAGVWEEAIMVYAGWRSDELATFLAIELETRITANENPVLRPAEAL